MATRLGELTDCKLLSDLDIGSMFIYLKVVITLLKVCLTFADSFFYTNWYGLFIIFEYFDESVHACILFFINRFDLKISVWHYARFVVRSIIWGSGLVLYTLQGLVLQFVLLSSAMFNFKQYWWKLHYIYKFIWFFVYFI